MFSPARYYNTQLTARKSYNTKPSNLTSIWFECFSNKPKVLWIVYLLRVQHLTSEKARFLFWALCLYSALLKPNGICWCVCSSIRSGIQWFWSVLFECSAFLFVLTWLVTFVFLEPKDGAEGDQCKKKKTLVYANIAKTRVGTTTTNSSGSAPPIFFFFFSTGTVAWTRKQAENSKANIQTERKAWQLVGEEEPC